MPFHHYNRTEIALIEERISGQIKHEKLMFPAEDILLNNLYFVVYSAIAKRNHVSPLSPQNTASFYAAFSLVFVLPYVFIILCMLFYLFLPSSHDFFEKHRKKAAPSRLISGLERLLFWTIAICRDFTLYNRSELAGRPVLPGGNPQQGPFSQVIPHPAGRHNPARRCGL